MSTVFTTACVILAMASIAILSPWWAVGWLLIALASEIGARVGLWS